MLNEDTIIQLPDGRYEQKVQVDRRKLEAMIIGSGNRYDVPNANQFFTSVMAISNAEVQWPSQLKIGAKTKKDPFVKVLGSLEQVETAKNLILNNLHVKKERVSVKMELHHSLHSHIIGKGGRGIQKVMKMTSCHIHFPDSNKYSDSNKSDQVSISGTPLNVFTAIGHLRAMCPMTIFMDLPWFHAGTPDLRQLTTSISVISVEQNIYRLMLKTNVTQDAAVLFSIRLVLHQFGLSEEYLTIRTNLLAKEDVLYQMEQIDENREKIREMSSRLGVSIQIASDAQSLILSGPPPGVLQIRKFLVGLSTIHVSFDCNVMDVSYPIAQLEKERALQIATKRKNSEVLTISMKSIESKLAEVLQARELLLALPPTVFTNDEFLPSTSSTSNSTALPPLQMQTPSDSSSRVFLTPPIESPKSPDPEDSPLAASILKGAKDISKNWKQQKTADRGEMLMKATQAIFDDSVLSRTSPRYPTDLWSGYGFSSSLPADLLKGMFDLSTSEENSSSGKETPPIFSCSRAGGGLYSVREEDELSDFSASSNNYSLSTKMFEQKARNVFSASTSVFDSSSLPYDVQWDINYYTDPSMVLSQLGCSEYMTQLRDQEIDMHAFLLLDEQNLKDIGVSTIGARKKIHHAILKLRDSARLNGYAV